MTTLAKDHLSISLFKTDSSICPYTLRQKKVDDRLLGILTMDNYIALFDIMTPKLCGLLGSYIISGTDVDLMDTLVSYHSDLSLSEAGAIYTLYKAYLKHSHIPLMDSLFLMAKEEV